MSQAFPDIIQEGFTGSSLADVSDSTSLKSFSHSVIRLPQVGDHFTRKVYGDRITGVIDERLESPESSNANQSLGSEQNSSALISSSVGISSHSYEHPIPLPSNHQNPFVLTPPLSTNRSGPRGFYVLPSTVYPVDDDSVLADEVGYVRYPIRTNQLHGRLVDASWKEEQKNSRHSSLVVSTGILPSSLGWLSPTRYPESQIKSGQDQTDLDDGREVGSKAEEIPKTCCSDCSSLGSWIEDDEQDLRRSITDVAEFPRARSSLPLALVETPQGDSFENHVTKVGEHLYRHTVHGSLESVKGFDSDDFYERVRNHPIRRGQLIRNIKKKPTQSLPIAPSKLKQYAQHFRERSLSPASSSPLPLSDSRSPLSIPAQPPTPPKIYTAAGNHIKVEGSNDMEIANIARPKTRRDSHKRVTLNQLRVEQIMAPSPAVILESSHDATPVPRLPDRTSFRYTQSTAAIRPSAPTQDQKRNRFISAIGCLCASLSCCLLPAYGWGALDPCIQWVSDGECNEFHQRDKRWARIATYLVVVLAFFALVVSLIRYLCF